MSFSQSSIHLSSSMSCEAIMAVQFFLEDASGVRSLTNEWDVLDKMTTKQWRYAIRTSFMEVIQPIPVRKHA